MIYTELTKKAMRIAFDAHKEKVDKAGLPYIFHPFHLAEQMATEDEVCVALLHDVVEDTDITFEDLRSHGFPESVMSALALLTHDDRVEYEDYIERIKINSLAVKVKLSDLRHNRNLTRLPSSDWSRDHLKRFIKYGEAILILYGQNIRQSESEPLKRTIIPLDENNLWYLSVFRDKSDKAVKYSFDVEKASDSHYQLPAEEFDRLAAYFGCVDTIEALKNYIKSHSERDFINLTSTPKQYWVYTDCWYYIRQEKSI